MPTDTIKVFLADDEGSARSHLKELLSSYPEMEIAGISTTGTDARTQLSQNKFDLAFLDIGMPGLTGIEVIKELQKQNIPLPYIIFTTAYLHLGAEAFDLGAIDYILKPVSESRLEKALEKFQIYWKNGTQGSCCDKDSFSHVLANSFSLTKKEIQICCLVKSGKLRDEISQELNMSEATVKTHLAHIYDKTGLSDESSGRGDKFSRLLFLLFNL